MMPPRCEVCDRAPLREEDYPSFKTVRFAINADEAVHERKQEQAGWAGHNPWLMWFCDEHLALGEQLANLHWREASNRLHNRN